MGGKLIDVACLRVLGLETRSAQTSGKHMTLDSLREASKVWAICWNASSVTPMSYRQNRTAICTFARVPAQIVSLGKWPIAFTCFIVRL